MTSSCDAGQALTEERQFPPWRSFPSYAQAIRRFATYDEGLRRSATGNKMGVAAVARDSRWPRSQALVSYYDEVFLGAPSVDDSAGPGRNGRGEFSQRA